jgi:hypothetical protein
VVALQQQLGAKVCPAPTPGISLQPAAGKRWAFFFSYSAATSESAFCLQLEKQQFLYTFPLSSSVSHPCDPFLAIFIWISSGFTYIFVDNVIKISFSLITLQKPL